MLIKFLMSDFVMGNLPIIERQCSHKLKKVVRREIFETFFITAIDLCKNCKNKPEFSKNIKFVDKKIIPRQKSDTKSQIKKSITKRKMEINQIKEKRDEFWSISDTMKKIPKLIDCYGSLGILQDELNQLYVMYIEKIEKTKS